jgi:hypothetical protein
MSHVSQDIAARTSKMSFAYLEKISLFVAVALPLCVCYFWQDLQILSAVIFFGQGHFLLAYFYANKHGKINKNFLIKFCALVGLLGVVCIYFFGNYLFYTVMLFLTSIIFTFHYSNDEFKIAGYSKLPNKLFLTMATVFAFAGFLLERLFHISPHTSLGVSLVGVFISISLFGASSLKLKRNLVTAKEFLFALLYILNLIIPTILIFKESISASQVIGFIILFHYVRWYFYYGALFQGKEFDFYCDAVIWVNMFILMMYIQYALAPTTGLLYLFYHPLFFYAWTVVHIILFLRKEDYAFSFKP